MNKQHIIIKERPINTQFVYRGHTLIVYDRTRATSYHTPACYYCFFKKQCDHIRHIMKIRYNNVFFGCAMAQKRHSCSRTHRTDNTCIYYEEVK